MMVIKMFTEVKRAMHENADFNRHRDQRKITELKNTITKLKNSTVGFNKRASHLEERNRKLEFIQSKE